MTFPTLENTLDSDIRDFTAWLLDEAEAYIEGLEIEAIELSINVVKE